MDTEQLLLLLTDVGMSRPGQWGFPIAQHTVGNDTCTPKLQMLTNETLKERTEPANCKHTLSIKDGGS